MKALTVLLPFVALAAVASEGTGPYSLTLKGKSFDERCLKLAAGESIRYRFRSTAPVDFNIHFHRGHGDLHFFGEHLLGRDQPGRCHQCNR